MIDAVSRPVTWTDAFYSRDLAGTVVLVGVPTPDMTLRMPLVDFFSRGLNGRLYHWARTLQGNTLQEPRNGQVEPFGLRPRYCARLSSLEAPILVSGSGGRRHRGRASTYLALLAHRDELSVLSRTNRWTHRPLRRAAGTDLRYPVPQPHWPQTFPVWPARPSVTSPSMIVWASRNRTYHAARRTADCWINSPLRAWRLAGASRHRPRESRMRPCYMWPTMVPMSTHHPERRPLYVTPTAPAPGNRPSTRTIQTIETAAAPGDQTVLAAVS